MRKHIVESEIASIVLTFGKFITNAHKKEKRLRNHNVLVNTNLSVSAV